MSELLTYQVALTLLPGIGAIKAKNLVSYCGSVEAVFKQKKSSLLKIPEIGPVLAEGIIKQNVFAQAEQEVKFIKRHKIQPLFYLDDNYPHRLKQCNDAPVLLYYKGNAPLNTQRVLAIVGTRKATEYGRSVCAEIIEGLSDKSILIVSGLAYGIDINAHRDALKNGYNTVGVVGHGLDRIYPGSHTATARKMSEQGGILTEFISGTDPSPENFPARNRIVAGMSDATLVIEAAEGGGALITAEIANSYNRDVFAIPGRTKDEFSRGCNNLIRMNKAALIQSAEDLQSFMSWDVVSAQADNVQQKLWNDLSDEEQEILQVLSSGDTLPIDVISIRSGLSASKTGSVLLNLEFKGLIKAQPGKMFRLI